MKTPQVIVKQFIRGRRERVFEAWLDPKLAVQWFSPESLTPLTFKSDRKVGGKYHHTMRGEMGVLTTVGEYLEIIPNRKLVFTWGKEEREVPPTSVVTVEFTDQDDGTLVTLTHTKLPIELEDSHQQGWESALRHLDSFFKGENT